LGTSRKAKLKKAAEKERRQRAKTQQSFDKIVPLVGADDLFRRFTEDASTTPLRLPVDFTWVRDIESRKYLLRLDLRQID
jgi:hypothetical protein